MPKTISVNNISQANSSTDNGRHQNTCTSNGKEIVVYTGDVTNIEKKSQEQCPITASLTGKEIVVYTGDVTNIEKKSQKINATYLPTFNNTMAFFDGNQTYQDEIEKNKGVTSIHTYYSPFNYALPCHYAFNHTTQCIGPNNANYSLEMVGLLALGSVISKMLQSVMPTNVGSQNGQGNGQNGNGQSVMPTKVDTQNGQGNGQPVNVVYTQNGNGQSVMPTKVDTQNGNGVDTQQGNPFLQESLAKIQKFIDANKQGLLIAGGITAVAGIAYLSYLAYNHYYNQENWGQDDSVNAELETPQIDEL